MENAVHLPIWSIRWGRIDRYEIERTDTGWQMAYIDHEADCEPSGSPFLQDNAAQDAIHYPAEFGDFLAHLWQVARENNMDETSIQAQLLLLGKWQEAMEKNRPQGIWEGIL